MDLSKEQKEILEKLITSYKDEVFLSKLRKEYLEIKKIVNKTTEIRQQLEMENANIQFKEDYLKFLQAKLK